MSRKGEDGMVFFKHEMRMNIKSLAIWCSVVGGMVLMVLLMFPSMAEQMKEISNAYSSMGAFSEAFGMGKIDMGTINGFYSLEAGSMISIGGSMFAAIIGTGILSKEEGGHTTEFIYVTPHSRTYFLTQKLVAATTVIVIFNVVCVLFAMLGFAIIGEEITWKKFLLYHLAQLIMQLQIGAMCFGLSAYLRKVNIGLGIGIALLLYFVNIIANITDKVEALRYVTPFYYSDAANIFDSVSIPMAHLLVGIMFGVVGILLAYVQYRRKDLNI